MTKTKNTTPTKTTTATPSTTHPHASTTSAVVRQHGSHVTAGLRSGQVEQRLGLVGPNTLPAFARAGPLDRLLSQFRSPLVYVLLAAGGVTLALGETVNASVIAAVIALNAAVGLVQETKAATSLEALRSLIRTSARVVRDGRTLLVPSDDLVPGDLVLLEAGDKVPADLRVVDHHELSADESALTGESEPVHKVDDPLGPETAVADRLNMLWSGTLVTAGAGSGIVVATGASTELGAVHSLIATAQGVSTPLTRQLASFSRRLTIAILGLSVFAFVLGLLRGADSTDMLIAAVALAVAAIPEGLPAAATVALAVGANRMAHRRAVARHMPAVEALGSTTVICTDKTGTLTENQMTVAVVWTTDREYLVSGTGYDPDGSLLGPGGEPASLTHDRALRDCLVVGVSCNDAQLDDQGGRWTILGDPTEGALLVSGAKAGLTKDEVARTHPRVDAVPFSSQRQWMATLHDDGRGGGLVHVKGAVEPVLAMCTAARAADGSTVPLDRPRTLEAVHRLAQDGLRLLAFATQDRPRTGPLDPTALDGHLVLVGLQAMLDPPRAGSAAAVAAFHTAGIDVKMITGDHPATAAAIARRIGLLGAADRPSDVVTGPELSRLAPGEQGEVIDRTSVFARVSPEQKLLLVRALQERGHVVTMTGDGVNDAPALKQADIGVAMGRGGTEVAKDAADVVLTDDDFATIEAAVEEGRGVFDNLTKFLVWTLPTNIAQALVILSAVLAGAALPILPAQILWINMTTAVALGLTLAFEPKDDDIMRRPPRDASKALLGRDLVLRMLLVAATLVAATWILFAWEQSHGASSSEARTAAVNLFVAVAVLYLFGCRSLTLPAWRIGVLANRWLLVGVVTQVLAQLAFTYVPAMQSLFGTSALDAGTWLRIAALAVVCTGVVAVDKALRANRREQPASDHLHVTPTTKDQAPPP